MNCTQMRAVRLLILVLVVVSHGQIPPPKPVLIDPLAVKASTGVEQPSTPPAALPNPNPVAQLDFVKVWKHYLSV